MPAALEMLDNLMIRAVEQAFGFGFPTEAGAVLIIEVDGVEAGLESEAEAITQIVQDRGGTVSAIDCLADPQGTRIRGNLEEPEIGLRRIGRLSPTSALRTGSSRERCCRISFGSLRQSASAMEFGSPTSSTRGTVISIPS